MTVLFDCGRRKPGVNYRPFSTRHIRVLDQKSIVGVSSFGEIPDLSSIPEELWPTYPEAIRLRRADRYDLSTDGWLYAEHPRRRVCWLPARSRPDRGTFSDNGCFLGLSFKWMEILHISQP
jgi:hypothetical protein